MPPGAPIAGAAAAGCCCCCGCSWITCGCCACCCCCCWLTVMVWTPPLAPACTTCGWYHLCEEASMPIEQVLHKLASGGGGAAEAAGEEVVAGIGGSSSNCDAHRPENQAMKRLKDEKQPISPFLRAKPGPLGLLQGPKHIHFNEDGSERKNGDSLEGKVENSEGKTDEIKAEVKDAPATPD